MAALELRDLSFEVFESIEIEGKAIDPARTNDGSIDRKGNPAIRACSGGWKSAILLLVNQGLATLAFFGVGVNLVLFLTRVLQQENADAANTVSKWTGTVYMFSLAGAFLSDSYWGRYMTCAIFQLIFVVGLVLLSLSSWLFLLKPAGCGDGELDCTPVSTIGIAIFYLSIYLIAFGNGGYQPTIATFGADQFDETDPTERRSKTAFFSYFYLALNLGSLFSNTILVYFEDTGKWLIGFWTAAGSASLALLLFRLGTPGYRHFRPSGNPLTRVAQVFVAASRKWDRKVPDGGEKLYELEGTESAIAGSRKMVHSNEFLYLDKAATITREDLCAEIINTDPWRLCTVTQVEEVKRVLKMLPIWLCTIIYSVVFTQMASLFVEQGATMDTNMAHFHIPPASMSAFDILSVAAFIFFYRRIIVPVAARFSGNPKGLTELQRMGIGLVISMLAMLAAGTVELERLKRVASPSERSSLSILWQIPQYVLIGASEVFMYVGQLEFFNGQAPDGIKSFGSSLCMASISLGNYVSCLIVSIVMSITTRDNSPGWIPENLNVGHLDRFYFLLAGLAAVDLVVYIACAKWYKYVEFENVGAEKENDVDMVRKV
ncbi:protein NRT1/ PTR FAMILY 7.2-like [Magnolia sinica]|uniref:protein NRT1/ PTR FAMILY 7.2-like n=1 Tax=Magnolia sinica TaxID=86752 RepID=UPI0026598CDF|nr:protein NRT1/ PTR FAMILY 7.2-like [Magnolia sinica]XP_058070787.1 protein NRT1/ PTR FAMILY 7.2-like [Magnolia sinica]